jgi:hypothetical protein
MDLGPGKAQGEAYGDAGGIRLICEAGTLRSDHANLMVSPSESSPLMARGMSIP